VVQAAMVELGLPGQVVVFGESTATAEDAAAAVGCELGQIVKTLVFVAEGRPTVVLSAGDRQVDTAALAQLIGVGRKKLKMGTRDEVRALTGFDVGGVAPIGMPERYDVVADESLRRFEIVWVAAGEHNAVFEATTEALVAAVAGQWAAITREPGGGREG
jgi:Cys-tRNA(Pro) deacylase